MEDIEVFILFNTNITSSDGPGYRVTVVLMSNVKAEDALNGGQSWRDNYSCIHKLVKLRSVPFPVEPVDTQRRAQRSYVICRLKHREEALKSQHQQSPGCYNLGRC